MVVHVFPAAKLGVLLMKQISKPIANGVKQGAKSSPVFRKYVCLPPAQFYNWCEVKIKMWLLHLGQPVNITVLNEAASIELGANLLGEAVIFGIAAGLLVFEYNRSSNKEAAKEEARKKELQDLKDAVRDLFIQTEEQGAYIREMTRKIGTLDSNLQHERNPQEKPSTGPTPPPQGPSPPLQGPSPNILQPNSTKEEENNNQSINVINNTKNKPLKGVIFKALSDVEDNMFLDSTHEREPGVLTIALNRLYKDVYTTRLTF